MLLTDRLERVWSDDRQSDSLIADLLLAPQHVTQTFPGVGCVVFIRTDIYETIRLPGRDKLRGEEMRLDWVPSRLADMALARARASVRTQELTCRVAAALPGPWAQKRGRFRIRDIGFLAGFVGLAHAQACEPANAPGDRSECLVR